MPVSNPLALSDTVPVTQAEGDTPDAGIAGEASRQDHRHGMPATYTPSAHVHDTANITTGRFGMARMPDGASGLVLTAQGAGVDPVYAAAAAYIEGARVTHSVSQTIPNATFTTIAFDTERWDTDGIHDNVVNNSRLTCRTAGKYLIVANIRLDDAVNGTRFRVEIYLNGITTIASQDFAVGATQLCHLVVATIYDLAVNDYVETRSYQNSGDSQTITKLAAESPEFMMHRIG